MRRKLGTSVFSGVLGVTAFGIFFTPVFYSVIRKFTESKQPVGTAPIDVAKVATTAAHHTLNSDSNGATPVASAKTIHET